MVRVGQLRRTFDWFYTQLNRAQSYKTSKGGSSYSSFKEEAWKRYQRRMREEYEEEMERVTAFRAKAMEYHPDQNQDSKEAAEAKFKEVMTSYEAIKLERKNGKL
ncbi:hypothetical protein ACLOJK_036074 [Asimina triloba]